VHGNPTDFVTDDFALAGVKAAADLYRQFANRISDSAGTPNSPSWAVKRSEESIARGVNLPPAILRKRPPNDLVVPVQKIMPAAISERDRFFRGTDNV